MKIQVQYQPHIEDIFVWGLFGPKTIDHILERINEDIKKVNQNLREIKEVL